MKDRTTAIFTISESGRKSFCHIRNLPLFWREVCQFWCEFNYSPPAKVDSEHIASQPIWLNSSIRLRGEVAYSPELYPRVREIRAFFKNGAYVTLGEWNQTYGCTWTPQDYAEILRAIPASWTLSIFHDSHLLDYIRKPLCSQVFEFFF